MPYVSFRLFDRMRKSKDDFARVAPYLIADVLHCFQKVTVCAEVKTNLLFGVYKLLDICDKHSRHFLAVSLADGSSEIFKHVLNNYVQYYQYKGHV